MRITEDLYKNVSICVGLMALSISATEYISRNMLIVGITVLYAFFVSFTLIGVYTDKW